MVPKTKYRFTVEGEFDVEHPFNAHGRIADLAQMIERRLHEHIASEALRTARCTRIDVEELGEEDAPPR